MSTNELKNKKTKTPKSSASSKTKTPKKQEALKPLKNTVVRIPSPSCIANFFISKIFCTI